MAVSFQRFQRRSDRVPARKIQSQLQSLEQLETRCLLSAKRIWAIVGDTNPNNVADQITIDRDPAKPATLRAIVNGEVVSTRPDRRLGGIRIDSGAGADIVLLDERLGAIVVPATVMAGDGDDLVTTASGRDSMDGGSGSDTLIGGAGRDRLRGGEGANRLDGGDGSDDVRGGSDNDTIWGGMGNDRLEGLGGRDRIQGGSGRDLLLGGYGDDTLIGHGSDPISEGDRGVIRAARSGDEPARDDDLLDGGEGDDVLVGEDEDTLQNGRPPETLEHLSSCTDVAQRLMDQAQKQYSWYTGGGWGRPGGGIFLPLDSAEIETFSAGVSNANGSGSNSAPPIFSGTNNQELGVDEADIVKTNGNYIYVLRNGELLIIDALPAEGAAVISQSDVAGYAFDMFLHGDRLMVFSEIHTDPIRIEPVPLLRIAQPDFGKAQLKVTVFDVADPETPKLVHESFLDGSYINARLIDGRVYLVLNNSPQFPIPWVRAFDKGSEVESPEHFQERLATVDPNSLLPQFRSIDYTEAGQVEQHGDLIVDCSGVYKTSADDWMNLTTVLAFDLAAPTIGGPADSATVFGHISTVYASSQNLYLVNPVWHGGGPVTGIHKVALGDDIRVEASGEVPGNVLNQFSLDESNGYFRIATTTNWWDSETGRGHSANHVFILSEEQGTLNVVGSVEGLAPDEQIFAARFFDDRAFVVTFRQVDPLFALDLSNPTDPKVAGELKVTGFSRYLHPVGDTHLLAIGRDADETGRVRGLQASLFDVSDLNEPQLVEQYLIQADAGWSWTAAEWDHHAFAYFADAGVMSIPVQGSVRIESEDDGDPGTPDAATWETRSAFWVFEVDLESGLDLLGQVTHESAALRSLRVNDMLYTLADDDIRIQPLEDPTSMVRQVPLE